MEKRTGSTVRHQQTGRPRYLREAWSITLFIRSLVVLLDLLFECPASTLPWTWLNVSFLSQLRFGVVIAWRIPHSRLAQPSSEQLIRAAEKDRTYLWEPPRYQEASLVEGTSPMLNKRRPSPEHHTQRIIHRSRTAHPTNTPKITACSGKQVCCTRRLRPDAA